MKPYILQTAKKIVAGCHTFENVTEHLEHIKPKSVFIVAQPFVKNAGFLDILVQQLEQKGINVEWNLGVIPEPTVGNIESVFKHAKHIDFELIIGIGGGSVLDATKILSVLKTNNMPIQEMLGTEMIPQPGIPSLLIPTTSGTGSEVTPNAIVTLPDEEMKMGIVSRYLLPELVILDPLLTVGLPQSITAATGMDAFTHAIESYISNKSNPISDMFALESIRKISQSIIRSYDHGQDINAREQMMLGSTYGGLALSSAGTAAVHAMAYPIGGKFKVPHGVANAMLLPHVMEFNLESITYKMAQVALAMGLLRENEEKDSKLAEKALRRIQEWTNHLHIPQDLKAYGVEKENIKDLSIAASNVKRLMDNNPKKMKIEDISNIYMRLI